MYRKTITIWHLQSCPCFVPYVFLTLFSCVRCVLINILLCLTVGLCNILLIPVTLNLAKAHLQIRHKHVRHTSVQKTVEPVGNLGAENSNLTNGSLAVTGTGMMKMLKPEESFMLSTMPTSTCNNMSSHRLTYTNTQKLYAFKNMLLGTPYRLDAILSACTPLYIHRIQISRSHSFHSSNVCICSQFNFMTD